MYYDTKIKDVSFTIYLTTEQQQEYLGRAIKYPEPWDYIAWGYLGGIPVGFTWGEYWGIVWTEEGETIIQLYTPNSLNCWYRSTEEIFFFSHLADEIKTLSQDAKHYSMVTPVIAEVGGVSFGVILYGTENYPPKNTENSGGILEFALDTYEWLGFTYNDTWGVVKAIEGEWAIEVLLYEETSPNCPIYIKMYEVEVEGGETILPSVAYCIKTYCDRGYYVVS